MNASFPVSADDILASHFTIDPRPGEIEDIRVPGAEGWTSPNPHPALSLMRWMTAEAAEAETALDAVLEQFRVRGHGVDWMTGPRCAEAGLLPLLAARGFASPPLVVAAMARDISTDAGPQPAAEVQVRRADPAASGHLGRLMGKGFGVPEEVGEIYHNAYMTGNDRQRSEVYAASLSGSDTPVGVGYLSYIGDGAVALLRASCTLEDSRGQGVYRALVAQRLHDAAAAGCTTMVVHAYSQGSQACLRELGFESTGALLLHRWVP